MGILILFEQIFKMMNWEIMLALSVSTSLGIIIGALPGLTATMGIALLTGLTYGFETYIAIPVLMGIYVGAIFGGSISAILINIPGTGASAATALDGHPLAKIGEAKTALIVTRFASMIGTFFGLVCLISFAPIISLMAEKMFSSPEFFLLSIFGIVICGSLTAGDRPVKGWISGMLGVLVSTIGIEEMFGYQRFVYGNPNLLGGIAFIPAMIGVFGIPQIIDTLRSGKDFVVIELGNGEREYKKVFRKLKENWKTILQSGFLGVGVGSIPGVGEDIAAWMAYDRAKKSSKHPEKFGHGSYEGLIAAEAGNNSCIGGSIIPLLTLAVPGSAPAAVLLGALYLHGIRPGPMLAFEFPTFTYEMTAILFWATVALLVFGTILSSVMVKVLKVKPAILMPIVGALSVIGSYAIGVNMFDILVMGMFGIVGYFLVKMGYPPAPLILGAILGPLADSNFRRSLMVSDGNPLIFVSRPISAVFVVLIITSVLSQFPFWNRFTGRIKAKIFRKKSDTTVG